MTRTSPAPRLSTSPCGCGGCEKWADCAYCYTCTPETEFQAEEDAYWRQYEVDQMPFHQWLEDKEAEWLDAN